MSSVETGQMSAVETGQMSAAETGQMSAVETRQNVEVSDKGSGVPAAMGLVQSQAKLKSQLTKVPARAQIIKFGPRWIENQRFGLKLGPNESRGLSGPIRTRFEAKNPRKYNQNS